MIAAIGWSLLAGGCAGLGVVFFAYPLACRLRSAASAKPSESGAARTTHDDLKVSVIVAMRNAEKLIGEKLASLYASIDLTQPLQILLASDGSTDETVTLARRLAVAAPAGCTVEIIELQQHHGKHVALNEAAARAIGDVFVFTDVDAVLEPRSIAWLTQALRGDDIGGVCGRRSLGEAGGHLESAQSSYVALDSGLKALESRFGSITSNDGKLYALRREVFHTIPEGVTDDLFAAMAVVAAGKRFVYEGRARAWIRTPSRSSTHELSRRRRIVCRSLRGIWLQRAVLNPARTGMYAFGLFVNKVGRRLMPVMLAACALGLTLLATESRLAAAALLAAGAGVALAVLFPWLSAAPVPRPVAKLLGAAHYFVVGCAGTLLGVIDFLLNRRVVRWEPRKAD